MLPLVTILAGIVAYTFSGSILVEGIFGWPGVGNYSLQAIQTSDFPAIQGFVLYSAVLYVVLYEVLNSVYAIIDPRAKRMSLLPGLGRAALDRLPATRRAGSLRSRSASLKVGLAIVALFAITPRSPLVWTPYPPDAKATGNFSAPPDAHHLFGTDATGGDVFSRALAATHHRRRDHARRGRNRARRRHAVGRRSPASTAAGSTA